MTFRKKLNTYDVICLQGLNAFGNIIISLLIIAIIPFLLCIMFLQVPFWLFGILTEKLKKHFLNGNNIVFICVTGTIFCLIAWFVTFIMQNNTIFVESPADIIIVQSDIITGDWDATGLLQQLHKEQNALLHNKD